ncbi:sensor histidine kinase [Lachnoclostridium sp. MSJ-17]|uniref:sensor histidine kinase n=1 Tax=Lachnoclostridium sp. MSJ-17 TaxID=2841516 RepID=UPI001C0F9EC4|nr:HAMP domain-containing sensor histidine kinase [Lachnoclostridium sp. MSJ-17]MBU5462077.1 HAMP domain-containing histidine kinase [Lachnoclostridium sp. MSJ-17]
MIKKLRWRIALINLGLIGIVLIGIFTAVCINNFSNSYNELEHGLNRVIDRNSAEKGFEPATDDSGKPEMPFDKNDKDSYKNKPDIRENAPMEISSYVVAETDKDGNIVSKEESNVTIDSDDLEKCVEIALARQEKSGQISDYSLMYVKKSDHEKTLIVFAGNTTLFENLRNSILINTGLFLGSMVIILFISLGLSRLAVNPVKKAWEQQKQFVADASHELKTPLTVILANNNIMMSHKSSTVEQEQKWLESTEDEAQHMKQLIDQMLFLAKSDAGESHVQLSQVNFSEIVEGSALNFEPVAFEKEVLIDTEIAPDITLEGNQTQLNQLAHILIDNAVKYSDENSVIRIILSKKNDSVEFSVNNRGNVISKEDIDHIFDRFYRAEKSRTTKGYGLGLSIAKNIVQSMNGRLSVQSNQDDGTTFTAVFKTK